jgi:hypothetical protein
MLSCLATPVEIAHAVERCAQDFYCGLSEEEREKAAVSAQVTVEALMAQLEQFEMASKRDAEDLQAIRNTAYYALPASSKFNCFLVFLLDYTLL